jgi:cysteine-rich repeat protein
VCGNGIVETGETCDDNNTISGDGCNSLCEAETGTCSDGLDNNGDGLVDWSGGDLDCANSSDSEGSTPSGSLKNNWTVFHPSADSRIVYVSQSTGNDANDGLSASTPKKTVAAGAALIRNQYDYPYNATRYPDWLLLKRGDSWNESLGGWSASGRSNTGKRIVLIF